MRSRRSYGHARPSAVDRWHDLGSLHEVESQHARTGYQLLALARDDDEDSAPTVTLCMQDRSATYTCAAVL